MSSQRRDRKLIDASVKALATSCGDRLRTVALCGEAAGAGYRPGRSRLDFAVLVDTVDGQVLKAIAASRLGAWTSRVTPPLVLDATYISSSLDVFPLEFLDLCDRHEVVFGASDPFADLSFEREHLRLHIEQQLRGKLLHLREAYIGARGSRSKVRRLLIDTPAAFETIARGILYVVESLRPTEPTALFAAVENELNLALPTLRLLEQVRTGSAHLTRKDVEPMFDSYLAEVEALVARADSL